MWRNIPWRNNRDSWGRLSRLLHWSTAGLVFLQLMLGLLAVSWPLSPLKLDLFVWHKSFGMLVLALTLLRLGWRWANPVPRLPATMPAWQRRLAHLTHALLYGLLLALPLTGWLINSAANIPFRIFWLVPLPDLLAPDRQLAELFKTSHAVLIVLLLALLGLHIGAALYHHYRRHDGVLLRMGWGRQ